MDNQHRKIAGYRELSQADIDLMNKIKAHGPVLEELVAAVRGEIALMRQAAANVTDVARLDRAEPERWAALARTHFQEGLMALTRAVAQPTTF